MACRGAETASVWLYLGEVGLAAPPPEWPQEGVFLDQQRGAAHTHTGTGSHRGQKSCVPQQAPTCHRRVGRGSKSSPRSPKLLPRLGAHPQVRLCLTKSPPARKQPSHWHWCPESCGFRGGVSNKASGSAVREAPHSSAESGTCCPREEVPQRDLEVSEGSRLQVVPPSFVTK